MAEELIVPLTGQKMSDALVKIDALGSETIATQADLDALVLSSGTATEEQLIAVNNLFGTKNKVIGVPESEEFGTTRYGGSGFFSSSESAISDGSLLRVEFYALTANTVAIGVWSTVGTKIENTQIVDNISVSNGFNSLTPDDFGSISIKEGDYIAIRGDNGTYFTYINEGVGTAYNFDSSGISKKTVGDTQNVTYQYRYEISETVQVANADAVNDLDDRTSTIELNKVTYDLSSNLDKIIILSNSYNYSSTLKGKSPCCLISSLSDFNFSNRSVNGMNLEYLSQYIMADTKIQEMKFSDHKPKYAIIVEHQNSIGGGTDVEAYLESNQKLIDILKGKGIIPILMSEWASEAENSGSLRDGEMRAVKALKALAQKNKILFVDGTTKSRLMTPTTYANFWVGSHPQVRTNWIIVEPYRKIVSQLPRPSKTLKIFRARNTPTNINDLLFTDINDRYRLFQELYTAHGALDDLYNSYYDDRDGSTTSLVEDEYFNLLNGSDTVLGEHSLIETIVPYRYPSYVKVTISDTDNVECYAVQRTNTGQVLLQISLSSGGYTIPKECVDEDKISLIFYKSGGLTLNESPTVECRGGIEKYEQPIISLEPSYTTELLSKTLIVEGGIINSEFENIGNLPVVIPDDGQLPTGVSGCVEISTTNGLKQDFSYDLLEDTRDVIIKVWARTWKPIFDKASDFSTSEINVTSCDTSTLVCSLTGQTSITSAPSTFKYEVGLHWTEIEFRASLSGLTLSSSLHLYSENDDIQVAKASVKFI